MSDDDCNMSDEDVIHNSIGKQKITIAEKLKVAKKA